MEVFNYAVDSLRAIFNKIQTNFQTLISSIDSLATNKIDSAGVTFENLNTNGDVGTGAEQVAQGNHVHNNATQGIAGFLSLTDKQKLDAIANFANNYVHPTAKQCNYAYIHPSSKQCDYYYVYTHPTVKQCTGGNCDTIGNLSVHTGVNNLANRVVRTDASGYCYLGWIKTISGAGSGTISRVYASNDEFIRYYTMANFSAQIYTPSNSWGAKRTLFSTGDPSGGQDGDLWVKYI